MRVGQVPPGLCACSQGLSWSAPWRGLPGEREPLSFNSIEHAYDRWLDADPTAVNPLPFEFVHATAERAVVDTLGSTSALGPTSGGTLVIVHGSALARGHDRRCIFGTGVVNATLASYCSAVVTCSDASHRRRWMWAGWAWQAAAAWCRSG